MKNILNSENLEDIFDIEDLDLDDMVIDIIDDIDVIDNVDSPSSDSEIVVTNNQPSEMDVQSSTDIEPTTPKNDVDFVNDGLKDLLTTTTKLMDAASFLLNGAPDAETVASASTMVGSIKDILSELNKSVLIRTRYEEQTKLEQLKIEARVQNTLLKAKQKKVDMGSGNTFIQNTQNNEYVASSQEDIVEMIIGIQKKSQQDIKRLN